MSDSCDMRIKVAPQDVKRFQDEGFDLTQSDSSGRIILDEDGLVHLSTDEIAYGGEYITALDVPWFGASGSGGSYSAQHVYCLGDGTMHTWPVGNNDGTYAVDFSDNGVAVDGEMTRLQAFIEGMEAAIAATKARAALWTPSNDACVVKLSNDEPIDILREFVEDVRVAFGTGHRYEIDSSELSVDWPDLLVTYDKAVRFIENLDRRDR